MAGTGESGTRTFLVAGGILAIFCGFLLFLVIPAHLLLLPVILGTGVMIFVAVFMIRTPGPVIPEEPVPDPSFPGPGTADEPALMPGNPYYRRSPLGYRVAALIAGWLVLSFFWYEIWPRMSKNIPVPLPLIGFQLILLVGFCRMLWRCRNLPPAMDGLRQSMGRTGTALNAVIPLLWEGFGVYIVAAIILNGGLAVLLIAASDGILSINFTGANGFIVFLLFAFGNLLIFALVLLRMEWVWHEPAKGNGTAQAGAPGTSPGTPDPATRYAVMTILALVFTALFFAVPLLAFSTGIIGPEAHDREIYLVVERADPGHVTVTLAGGKDAGTLVALVAEEYEKIEPSYFDQGKDDRQFITEMQVGPKTGTVPLANGTRFSVVGQCNSTCIVTVDGYFSDGKRQRFYNAVV
jgi:hypothetical protein